MSHEIEARDLTMARRVAAQYGPDGDGELESAAMAGLLSAAQRFDGRGSWRPFAQRRIRWALLDAVTPDREVATDPATLPDTAQPIGMWTTDEPMDEETVETVHEVLAGFDATDMLERVDRRRTAHRQAIAYLTLVLS